MSGEAKKVLVLEDEVLVALDIVGMIEDRGFRAMGPYHRAENALAALETETPDFAILDVNLGPRATSEPVARRLDELGVPFAFATGYASTNTLMPGLFSKATKIAKPLAEHDLATLLDREMPPARH
ncbi:hypothetical protein P6F26_05260 [Roseibacterium sp. SDUM158017]|uniref:hypothetical protein n=1 Tax=Roseicyclus salinarum TaxID=3036773 RepID=UPI0024154AD3|nr:hypothetical protein [Roseibacterium sp. SDUM158017]MDG4647843.1 hypothetical protein [Roseibacterium sp. SDUM158017]